MPSALSVPLVGTFVPYRVQFPKYFLDPNISMSLLDIFTPKHTQRSDITTMSVFKLPIEYLEQTHIHTLSPIIEADLELETSQNSAKSVYDIALKPQHAYSKAMISRIKTKYTTHTGFLE